MRVAIESHTRPAGSTNTGEHSQNKAAPSGDALFRKARQWADERGLNVSHSKLSRLVRGYNRARAERPALTLETYLRRTWADPVGESVARNVDAGRTSLWAERRGGDALV
ncbi:MAG: hypothetical protein QJR09_13605 [Micrococcus sp.]|nr:hypothetical protein [Micrococcus sp.]